MRNGQLFSIPMAIVVAGAALILVIGAVYTGIVVSEVKSSTKNVYTGNIVGEQFLNAPCATRSRAVFYNSSLASGAFNCIHPRGTFYLTFKVGDGPLIYRWKISTDSGETVVQSPPRIPTRTAGRPPNVETPPRYMVPTTRKQTYQVLVYAADTGETVPATLEVGTPK